MGDTCDYTGSEVKIDRHMWPRDENEENSDSQGNNFDKDWMSRFDMPDELQVHSGLDGDKSAFLSFVNGFSYFVNRFPNPGKRLELAELKNLFDSNLYITGNLGVQNEFRGQAHEERGHPRAGAVAVLQGPSGSPISGQSRAAA